MQIDLPRDVRTAMEKLNRAGYDCFAVGGCVRDSLRGVPPHDWDLTTCAWPRQIKETFADYRTVDIGIAHGTVAVVFPSGTVEITTYRIDGGYRDSRHPDRVTFTPNLREDLSRRDFTVNAMAYHPDTGLIDPFGGEVDLKRGVIRCVGVPARRFGEDALRILRAVRFSSALSFRLEGKTAGSVHRMRENLRRISAERIREELTKLLMGKNVREVLSLYSDVIAVVIPELAPCIGFEQHNIHHCHDVWGHTVESVSCAAPDPVIRWTMLLHDIGKPETLTLDGDTGHFYGHEKQSAELAAKVLKRLKFDTRTAERVVTLIRSHMLLTEPAERAVKRRMNQLTPEVFLQLLDVMRADTLSLAPEYHGRTEEIDRLESIAREILEQGQCFSLRDLAVNGNDLLAIGYQGREIGEALNRLLDAVIGGKCENKREALLAYDAAAHREQEEEVL